MSVVVLLLCAGNGTSSDRHHDITSHHSHRDSLSGFSVVEQVWRQQSVFRLLQLVELPLLESLLEGQEIPRPALHSMDSDPDLLYTSSYLDREVLKAFSEAQ